MPFSKSFRLGKFHCSFQITRSALASTSDSRACSQISAEVDLAPKKPVILTKEECDMTGMKQQECMDEATGMKQQEYMVEAIEMKSKPVEFLTLPTEIRDLIYREILVSKEPIHEANKLIGDNVAILLNEYKPIIDIDSAILRTCRTIYTEALHVLYGQNTFHFSDAGTITSFRPVTPSSRQALSLNTRYGRLALIRCVSLKITRGSTYLENRTERREFIWNSWLREFFSEDLSAPPYGPLRDVAFPALQKVKLDFTDWKLEGDEGIRVTPFVRKLGEFGSLQELVVVGLKHEPSLSKIRDGLLKRGGKFLVVN